MESSYVKSFNYFDMSALSELKGKADDKDDEKLRVVAEQLESVFLELVLKAMHEANASMKSEFIERDNEEFYQQMFDKQLALSLSRSGGIGLADVIYKQLKPKDTNTLPLIQDRLVRTDKPISLKPVEIQPPLAYEQENKTSTADIIEQTEEAEMSTFQTSSSSVKSFIEAVLPHAKTAAKIIGVDPKVLLAQSALETGWGQHILQNENGMSSFNLFGVKSDKKWEGSSILAKTLEYADNKAEEVKANFKSYNSYLESFLDYINLLSSSRYEKALENTHDPKTFLTELHQAGYATDPQYVDKIMSIYEKFKSI